jgi:hypothetical protein
MKEKICNYFLISVFGALFPGLAFIGFFGLGYGILCGVIISFISFHNFCKEEEADKKKRDKQREIEAAEDKIEMKKYRAQVRKEKKERREWLKELKEWHPH